GPQAPGSPHARGRRASREIARARRLRAAARRRAGARRPPPADGGRARTATFPAMTKLIALRGATTVEHNDAGAILDATDELMHEILARNALAAEDLVSCIFTLTPDLDAEFPAVAARKMGLSSVPLLCAREIPVPGALPRVIRVLIHAYSATP